MLTGGFAEQGYDWWWHSFTGHHAKTGERRSFFIEFFCCNPALGGDEPVFGQMAGGSDGSMRPCSASFPRTGLHIEGLRT